MQTAVKDARQTAVCIQTATGGAKQARRVGPSGGVGAAGAAGTNCAVPKSARSVRAIARDVAILRADIERYRAELRDALELVRLSGKRSSEPARCPAIRVTRV